jgi:hypothetical protein
MVFLVPKESRVVKDHKALMVLLESKEFRVVKDHKVHQEFLVFRALRDLKVLVSQEFLAFKVRKVVVVQVELLEIQEFKVYADPKVQLVLQEFKVYKVQLECKELQVALVEQLLLLQIHHQQHITWHLLLGLARKK